MAERKAETPLEKFIKVTGGLTDKELEEIDNMEKFRYTLKSKWFDVTGEENEAFSMIVATEYREKMEKSKDERDMRLEIVGKQTDVESKLMRKKPKKKKVR